MESLADIYQTLNEFDMWAAVWTKRAKFPETNISLAYEQQGLYTLAVECLEKVASFFHFRPIFHIFLPLIRRLWPKNKTN